MIGRLRKADVVTTDGPGRAPGRALPPGSGATPPRRRRIDPAVGLAASDGLSWAVALGVAVLLRYELAVTEIDMSGLLQTACGAAVVQVLVGLARRAYAGRYPTGGLDDAVSATVSAFVVGAVVFGVVLLGSPPAVPRSTPLIAMPIAALLLVGTRLAVRRAGERRALHGKRHSRRAIVYGSGEDARHLVGSMLRDPEWGIVPVAALSGEAGGPRRLSGVAVHGTGADLAAAVDRFDADMLIIALSEPDDDLVRELSGSASDAGIPVLVVPPLAHLVRSLSPVVPVDVRVRPGDPGTGAGTVRTAGLQAGVKRAVDVGLCLLALPVVVPVLLVVALVLVACRSEVVYLAPRVGRHGKAFTMFKFATMRPGDSGPRVTRESDPRITPVGRILRATKLNELPQVLNVLRGDMSIVGPRPEDPRYARCYTAQQRLVWSMRPGMTSRAFLEFGDEQVYIERARPDDLEAYYVGQLLPQKLAIDLDYVRTWSVSGDLRIVLRTMARLVRPAPAPAPAPASAPAPAPAPGPDG